MLTSMRLGSHRRRVNKEGGDNCLLASTGLVSVLVVFSFLAFYDHRSGSLGESTMQAKNLSKYLSHSVFLVVYYPHPHHEKGQ